MASDYLKITSELLDLDSKDYVRISNSLQDTIEKVVFTINPDQDMEIVLPI